MNHADTPTPPHAWSQRRRAALLGIGAAGALLAAAVCWPSPATNAQADVTFADVTFADVAEFADTEPPTSPEDPLGVFDTKTAAPEEDAATTQPAASDSPDPSDISNPPGSPGLPDSPDEGSAASEETSEAVDPFCQETGAASGAEGVSAIGWQGDPDAPEAALPSGPDMTRAAESGKPMAHGVSVDPAEVLLEVASRQRGRGIYEPLSCDPSTGRLVYVEADGYQSA